MRSLVPERARLVLWRASHWLFLASLTIAVTAHSAILPTNARNNVAEPAFLQLSQLQRTRFTTKDGLPPMIYAITEDKDGYLWLGGPAGLFRFDGVRFEPMFQGQLPPTDTITALLSDRDGNLWVGSARGKITRIANGRAELIDRGLTGAMILTLRQMADGTLWNVTPGGAARLIGGIWRRAGHSEGIEARAVRVTGTGEDGSFWIFATDAAYRLRPYAHRFDRYTADEGISTMADLPAAAVFPDHGVADDLIVDRYGALWVPTNGRLLRLHTDNGSDGKQLVTEIVKSLGDNADIPEVLADFVDTQGDVWIATPGGLEQFRATRFVPMTLPQPVVAPELVEDRDGGLWVASRSDTSPMKISTSITVHPEIVGPTICMASDPDGSVWFTGAKGIQRYKKTEASVIPFPETPSGPIFMMHPGLGCKDMRIAADGSLWISMQGYGISRWDGQVWAKKYPGEATSIQFEKSRTWLAFNSGKLIAIDQAKTTAYSGQLGPSVGQIEKIYLGSSGLWIAGSEGVSVKVGTQFHRLIGMQGERFQNSSDIVQLPSGDIWVASLKGVYRVSAAEIKLALSDTNHAVRFTKFDQTDGVENAGGIGTSGDGRLWVSMPQSIAWINAQHIPDAPPPPRVSILSINDQESRFSEARVQTLKEGTRNVAIAYTAATLSTPSRIHFRYLIKGVDDAWQSADDRREAHYANLGPGNYTFEVEASNADDVWSNQATSLSFHILPEFYQTWWFKILCAASILAGLWVLYLLRVKHVYAQLDARTRERERMARDFHDTILQSFQGLLLHIKDFSRGIDESTARQKLDEALRITENVLNEGRDKIGQLRSLLEPLEDLSDGIAHLANQLNAIRPMAFSLHVEGEPQMLNVSVANDVHAIIDELLTNAFRHSQANTVHVELCYGQRELSISVIDDGLGFDASVLSQRNPRHWGLQGMQERAHLVGGRFVIGAAFSDKGTHASLKIPSRYVYAKSAGFVNKLFAKSNVDGSPI